MESIVSNINKIRDKEQKKALNNWAITGFNGSIIAGTGFGKSRCAILACNYILENVVNSKIHILVPTIQLQDQFIDEFHKWDLENCLDNVEILCYQSAYKLKSNQYDLVVCDEIHLGLSPQYRKFFENNTYNKLLCMTATLPEEEEYKHLLGMIAKSLGWDINRVTGRVTELVNLGMVTSNGTHKDKQTNRTVTVWKAL